MATTTFSGPVVSLNGFDSKTAPMTLATPTTIVGPAALAINRYITIKGQDGNTYYVPVASAPPA